jgi:hypothetical protein
MNNVSNEGEELAPHARRIFVSSSVESARPTS